MNRQALVCASIVATSILLVASCEREDRPYHVSAPSANATYLSVATDFHAGGPSTAPAVVNQYENNAWALNEGKRLYEQMNCSGCHFHGGGGIGPPLMDDKWVYGSEPDQIYSTIIQGRPNGMPSFRGKIVDNQVWQIVAYVRSLSGQTSSTASSGRDDHIRRPDVAQDHKREPATQAIDHPPGQ